eukprot:10013201-Lingulodinium_polyedra.AAC.1
MPVGPPAAPNWNDRDAFHSFYLMDDQVRIEPNIGARTFESSRTAKGGHGLSVGANRRAPREGPRGG